MTPRFRLGTIVYHRLSPEEPGLITGITLRPGSILYAVTWTDRCESCHYEMELSDEQSFELN